MKTALKKALYAAGIAGFFHAQRNARTLTVAMFHRVLPQSDPRYAGADPVYTVTPAEFDSCLDLFQHHYNVVSLEAVEAAADGGPPLPERALLITFDDGWRDVIEYAAPALHDRRLPSVMFVATAHIGSDEGFLPELALDWALTADRPLEEKLELAGVPSASEPPSAPLDAARQVLAAVAATLPEQRHELAQTIRDEQRATPQAMADPDDLHAYVAAGGVIGGHGHSHEPMTGVGCIDTELNECRQALSVLPVAPERPPFSFPHGQYKDALIDRVRAADFGLVFTSDPGLASYDALAAHLPVPRVEMNLEDFRRNGKLDIAALAFHLFTHPHRA